MSKHIYVLANGQHVAVTRKNGKMIIHHNMGDIIVDEPKDNEND